MKMPTIWLIKFVEQRQSSEITFIIKNVCFFIQAWNESLEEILLRITKYADKKLSDLGCSLLLIVV